MKYEIKRGKTVILEKELQGKKIKQSPAVDYIDVTFSHPYAIQFKKNDVLTFKGQDYFLDETNNFITKNTSNNYDYKLKFQSRGFRATEIALLGYDLGNELNLTTFPINADLKTLVQLAVDNLNRGGYNIIDLADKKQNTSLNYIGDEIPKSNFFTTEFLDVNGYNIYIKASNRFIDLSPIDRRTISVCFYDENKTFVSYKEIIVSTDVINEPFEYPENAKYFKISRYDKPLFTLSVYTPFLLGNIPNTDFEYLQVDRENVMSFLSKLSSTFNEPFYIEDNVISFGANLNYLNKEYAYGRGKGFKNITNKRQQNKKLITKLFATGSTENLPEGYGSERLTIDPIFGDKFEEYGVIEGFYNNDYIMPTTSGSMATDAQRMDYNTVIPGYDYFLCNPNNLGYNIMDYGKKPQINFTSGDLNGVSMNCVVFDNGNGIQMLDAYVKKGEYEGLKIKKGDTFNITNIKQPPIVVKKAEDKLRLEAQDYLNKINGMANEIDVVCDPLYKIEVNLNDVITVKDDELGIQGDYVVNGFAEDLQPLKDSTLQLSFNYTQLKNINLKLAKSKISREQVQIYDLQQQINEINKKI